MRRVRSLTRGALDFLLPEDLRRRSFGRQRKSRSTAQLSYNEFAAELVVLGLAGVTFGPDEYAQALARYIGARIDVVDLNDLDYPLLRRALVSLGISGGLFYEPDARRIWIIVPSSLGERERTKLIYHELAHLAAGHPMRQEHVLRADPRPARQPEPLWEPDFRRLSQRLPPEEPALSEAEADLRARYALRAGSYGPAIYEREEYFLGLRDR